MDITHRGPTARSAVPAATSAAERFARWTGAAYAGMAIVGFGLTGFDDPMTTSGHMLVVFEVNPLQNLLRLVVGIALLVASAGGQVRPIAEADRADLPDVGAELNLAAAWRHELARLPDAPPSGAAS